MGIRDRLRNLGGHREDSTAEDASAPAPGRETEGGDALGPLLARLRAADPDERRKAADEIGRLGPAASAAVPGLIAALADENMDVRRAVAAALGETGDDGAVQPLSAALNDLTDYPVIKRPLQVPSRPVDARVEAARALGRIGGDSALEALRTAPGGDVKGDYRGLSVSEAIDQALAQLGAAGRESADAPADTDADTLRAALNAEPERTPAQPDAAQGEAEQAPAADGEMRRVVEPPIDDHVSGPEPDVDGPFLMPIEDVFSIAGRGTVVHGRVERGTVKVGDDVEVVGPQDETKQAVAVGIEMSGKLIDEGRAGDAVGVLLQGIERHEVERGMVLARRGSTGPTRQRPSETSLVSLLLEHGPVGAAIVARFDTDEGPTTSIVVHEDLEHVLALPEDPTVHARMAVMEQGGVLAVVMLALIEGEYYETWWNYHSPGQVFFHDMARQERCMVSFVVDDPEPSRTIWFPNNYRSAFTEAIERIESRGAWAMAEFDEAKDSLCRRFPSVQALWEALGGAGA